MRRLLLVSALLLSAVLSLQHGPASPRNARAEFPAADIYTSLLFECLPNGTVSVHLAWASSFQGPQWLDLSLFDNGFAQGTFITSGPLPAAQTALTWEGLLPDALHYVRVNTLTADGWFASRTMIFATPNDCPFTIQAPVPATSAPTCTVPAAAELSACIWTQKPDFATYAVGEVVHYCYIVSQPANVRIIAVKPDSTALIIVDGFVSGGACIGPYQANVPLGLRTVSMYGGPDMRLLAETHFFVN